MEDFQAWANGPVCPELFCRHKGLFVVDETLFADLPDYLFSEEELETLKAVLEYYGDKAPQWLSELTHKEAPWKEAREGVPVGVACANVISKESMQQYYGDCKNEFKKDCEAEGKSVCMVSWIMECFLLFGMMRNMKYMHL